MKLLLHRRSRGRPRVVRPAVRPAVRHGQGRERATGTGSRGTPLPVVRDDLDGPAPSRWRSKRSADRRIDEPRPPAPPIKHATWKWYIPIYFWLGGVSAGAWLAAAAEDIAGEGDPDLIRAARYIAAGGVAAGTGLLIIDLGRPDRFLNMLRIVRPRSTMSLGSWGLAAFGGWSSAAALLQALDDGILGRRRVFERLSRGQVGWLLHALGLPLALFVGGYTGVLLGTTSTPSWARRVRLLGPLFTASALSTGLSAVSLALEVSGGGRRSGARRRRRRRRRLARAEAATLAAELGLALLNRRRARTLPSASVEAPLERAAHALTLGTGMAVPLVAQAWSSRSGTRSRLSVGAALLTLGGGLALRFLTTMEGKRSALTPDDTWVFTGGEERGEGAPRRTPRRARPTLRSERSMKALETPSGEILGVVTIVQEDRIRVVDRAGRGYLFTLGKRRISPREVEQWRDAGVPVRVRYRGVPDVHARVERIGPLA